ncbi:MAG: protein-L-isoaspartate(D-aspartate) O-methyltransferase [Actinomycetota bacterium]
MDSPNFKKQREEMVRTQLISRGIKDRRVLEAMARIPREKFVDKADHFQAYADGPLPIGEGQTISQPYIVALMTELLSLKGNEKVLEVGTGSGYQTAILAELAGKVYSVEAIRDFYLQSRELLKAYKNVIFSHRNGYHGWEEHAPYERILVTAAPPRVPPALEEQLKEGGIMVIPVGISTFNQTLYRITKKDGRMLKKAVCSVAFVPLIEKI